MKCNKKPIYDCKSRNTFPYVCNACPFKENCTKDKTIYSGIVAQNISSKRRKSSREGIDLTNEDFKILAKLVKKGIEKGQSIFHICKNKEIKRSIKTVYNYIKKGYIDCKNVDSSKKLKFKKRKNKNQYDYRENFGINRIGRTFKDFIKYKIKNNIYSYVQMDFLGSRKDSDQQILTLHFLPLEFTYIAVFDKKCTVDDVVNLFNDLEKKLGFEDFNRIFHTVLTDRDILFNKYESFEQSSLDKNKKRMNIFYCNPASSSQKANVENSNNQLRRIFLKDDLIQDVTSSMISEINSNLNSRYLASLDGMTAYEAFNLAYGEKILKALDVNYVESNNVRILNYKSYASIQT